MKNIFFFLVITSVCLCGCRGKEIVREQKPVDTSYYAEKHRPQLHFSPPAKWMNDPNGMVFYKGQYHLFYQYYPDSTVWGPMHWGHAISKDLVHWTHLPIALYPDSLGLIFSGSAVIDQKNTSGLGSAENPPLVAIFTYHSVEKEKAGRTDYQTQGIAYSTDDGKTWTKFDGNPVLKNPGIKDFRDPKVFWHDQSGQWIMILAVLDHTELYSSPDLKSWRKLSEFGKEYAAHGGVWECPDLFELKAENSGESKWVMLVSLNPGGPNGGSSTQYFVGDFDGKTFHPDEDKNTTLWVDHGPDNYAGVTWSNVPDGRKIFLGWMSNWAYADRVPTEKWRSANTVPRDLSLVKVGDKYYVRSRISPEFLAAADAPFSLSNIDVKDSTSLANKGVDDVSTSIITTTLQAKDFAIELGNDLNQKVVIGFDAAKREFYIDRSKSGKNNFSENFFPRSFAPRILDSPTIKVIMVVDVSSVEVFFDDGMTVMTSLFFPDEKLSGLNIRSASGNVVEKVEVARMNSVWTTKK